MSTARNTVIPVSRAKTAYGLLQDVKRAILAEPKRVNMGTYISSIVPEDGGPACGTVGCFAGWVALLAPGSLTREAVDNEQISPAYLRAERDAKVALGPNIDYEFETRGVRYDVFNGGCGDRCSDTDPGTKAHARAVVARIDRFIRKNRQALRRRKLADIDYSGFVW